MKKNALLRIINQLRRLLDGYKQELLDDLPDTFNIPVDDVIDYKDVDGVETGIIISGQKRYRYTIDESQKLLDEIQT